MRRDLGRLKSCHNGGELISSLYYYVDENRLLSCDEEFYCQLLFYLSSTWQAYCCVRLWFCIGYLFCAQLLCAVWRHVDDSKWQQLERSNNRFI